MIDLVAGQRIKLAGGSLCISLECGDAQLLAARFSALVLFLAGEQAGSLAPAYAIGPDSKSHPHVEFDAGFTIKVALDRLPADVTRVQIIAYVAGGPGTGSTFRDLGWIEATADAFRFRLDLASCGNATLHLIDAYRHGGEWKLMANGQGFTGGLGVIGSRVGLSLDSGHGLPEPARADPATGPAGPGRGPPASGSSASGSGFVVTPNHVVTNHHVIEDARWIEVTNERRSGTGRVVFSDAHNDLALIETETRFEQIAHFREGIGLDLGEDVVLVGFPLQNLLGQGPQVTGGNVSGLCGFGNNAAILQYTAPTASGSSGGPILDCSGLVIGVVRAGLAHDQIRNAGSASENINFGIKGSVVRAFLDAAGIAAQTAVGGTPRTRAEIAREARNFATSIKVGF
jgi:S1-C subfamily serine protease